MAYSNLIECIHSALRELDLLKDKPFFSHRFVVNIFELLRFWLGNLKMVLLSATKLDVDLNSSSLVKTEDWVREIAAKVHTYDRDSPLALLSGADWLDRRLRYLYTLTQELFSPLLDAPRQSSNSFPMDEDEVLNFISFSLENLKNFQDLKGIPSGLRDGIKALGEQMEFLKNLILFVIQRNVEPERNLLAHAGVIAIDAAFLLFDDIVSDETYRNRMLELPGSFVEKMLLEVPTLVQKIKPVDPQTYKIYTEALSSTKLAARSVAPTDQGTDDVILQSFFSSLVSIFCEELARSTHVAVHIKDQLQQLYEGFRSLRQMILKQQPNKLDHQKIKEDIVNLVCDAGVFICSFQQRNLEIGLNIIQELSDATKMILSNLGEKHAQAPLFNSRSTTQLAFLDFLSEKLMELTSNEVEPTARSWAQTVRGKLFSLRSFLGDIVDLPNDQEELQNLMDRILEVAYRVEDAIDNLFVGNLPDSDSGSFYSLLKDISTIKSEIEVMEKSEIKVKKVRAAQSQVQSTTPSMTKEIVGFHDHATSIINRLTRGSKNLRIVAIVGMAGLGKTTLAEKVYDNPTVLYHFSVRAFTTVSQTFDKKGLLMDLIEQVDPDKYVQITSEKNAEDVADQLRRSLKGKRYLILLDDIWEAKAWQQLQQSFPDDSKGSRIIFTSRNHNVIAPLEMLDDKPFELRLLNKNESLNLLRRQLFGGNGQPTELSGVLMQIVEICNGLPLTIVIVAGLLRSMAPENWKTTMEGLTSGNLSERCRDTLELSYRHLPEHLKSCLLYFATFQEDQQVSVERLLSLWMAEGFIRKVEMKRLTDVAKGYLNDLIGRSLLMVGKKTSMGRVKRCRIHDLLYEFCSRKAKEERFFHFLEERYDEMSGFSESQYLRRLCISSGAKDFLESKVFCPSVRSLRFKYPKIQDAPSVTLMMHMCKLLRVLDLEHILLDGGIPSEIGQLVRLTYFAMRGYMLEIPGSIGKLSVLETFKIVLDRYAKPLLAESFWNLQKLKHLSFSSSSHVLYYVGARLSMENLDNSSDLYELDTVSGVVIPYDAVERVLKKFPNLRDLNFQLRGLESLGSYKGNVFHIVVPDVLTQLESLCVHHSPTYSTKVEFSLPTNIKKLTLHHFQLSGRIFSSIGNLPNLEYLRLIKVEFEGNTWIMEEEQFSKLRILKLNSSSLRCWSGSDDQFGCLEKLVLSNCSKLEEMPSCLETISTLQLIKAAHCHRTVTRLVQEIGEVQADYGNSDMKIIVYTERD
ncbi:OLC1v1014032C1 [Oldenlandia corymbosa var. corymbosa]|uniref:OLC1v1014032C1 n=1 Tax=Oldenlandia corymbosa var. corymbosa TaxID=529605 RepID=A0AAV1E345_OLDCO|nr:OLC1v1014032C1 [Oldenlandia corymbosa var. corymbosa]